MFPLPFYLHKAPHMRRALFSTHISARGLNQLHLLKPVQPVLQSLFHNLTPIDPPTSPLDLSKKGIFILSPLVIEDVLFRSAWYARRSSCLLNVDFILARL